MSEPIDTAPETSAAKLQNTKRQQKMWKAVIARTGQVGPNGRATPELKALLAATAGTLLGLVLQMVAVSTNSWLLLDLPSEGVPRNKSGQASVVVDACIGLWKICRVLRPVLKDETMSKTEGEFACLMMTMVVMIVVMVIMIMMMVTPASVCERSAASSGLC